MPDEDHSARRAEELAALYATHRENVSAAHKMYPVRLGVKFTQMPVDEQRRYNDLRAEVSSANRAYWRQVREACLRHREEEQKQIDEHLERAAKVPPHENPPDPAPAVEEAAR